MILFFDRMLLLRKRSGMRLPVSIRFISSLINITHSLLPFIVHPLTLRRLISSAIEILTLLFWNYHFAIVIISFGNDCINRKPLTRVTVKPNRRSSTPKGKRRWQRGKITTRSLRFPRLQPKTALVSLFHIRFWKITDAPVDLLIHILIRVPFPQWKLCYSSVKLTLKANEHSRHQAVLSQTRHVISPRQASRTCREVQGDWRGLCCALKWGEEGCIRSWRRHWRYFISFLTWDLSFTLSAHLPSSSHFCCSDLFLSTTVWFSHCTGSSNDSDFQWLSSWIKDEPKQKYQQTYCPFCFQLSLQSE